MKALTINEASPLPVWVQIKDQIKIAYSLGGLKEGDVLPSIRALADQLEVGEAMVRRAYEELAQSGFLSAEPRKHLMVTGSLRKPEHVEALARECSAQCEQLVEWARSRRVSPVAFARLLLQQATASEQERPCYVYVDLSRGSAERFASQISLAWGLPVEGMTIEGMAELPDAERQRYAGILVNYFRHERLLAVLNDSAPTVLPIRMNVHPRVVRKIKRLPAGSRVLLVLPAWDALRIGEVTLSHLKTQLGSKVQVEASSIEEIGDLVAAAERGRYALLIVSRHLWDDIPEKARRLKNVIPNENAIVAESLEKARVAAGVLV